MFMWIYHKGNDREYRLRFLFNAWCCFRSAQKFGRVGFPAALSPVAALSCVTPAVWIQGKLMPSSASFCRSRLILVLMFAGRHLCVALGQTWSARWAGSLCNRPPLGRGLPWGAGHTTQWHLAVAHLWLSSLVNKGEWEIFPFRVEKLERLMHLLFLHGSEMQVMGTVHKAFPFCLLFLSVHTVTWLSLCNSLSSSSMGLAANPLL